MSSTRRGFLALTAVSAVPADARHRGLKFFTADEARLLEAICEQVIPSDGDPGARDAGVIFYIDRQLKGPLKRFASQYRDGLAALAASTDFLNLGTAKQIAFLKSMESGELKHAAWTKIAPHAFFNMVVDHTMQGFYGSPRHGGNRGEASWKMLGIQKVMRENHNG